MWRGASSGAPQTIADGAQLADSPIEFLGLTGEYLAIDAHPPVKREHPRNLIEREAGLAPEHDQR